MNISHRKAAEILRHWNLEREPISDIYYEGSGQKSDSALYAGSDFILKFSANEGKVKNAIALYRAVEASDLSIPSLVATAGGQEYVQEGGLFFYLTRRLSGAQLLPCDFYREDSATKARSLGESIGQLHLILRRVDAPVDDADLYDSVKSWALPKAQKILSLPDSFCREYLDTFFDLYDKLPRQIIHRDPNPGNIIVSQDKWGFVDFELSERNARIYDPCYAATAILSESFDDRQPDKLAQWLEVYKNIVWGYDSVARLTNEERQALPYVLLANQLICVAWFSQQDRYAEVFEINQRMTRWLLSVFDELKL